ncbi:Hypothetical protein AA314_09191 [Archangium gephyra]|uniref:Uncharacterized protein n=1 Tax=Archangium gephyra TaxID=48 RepID=A0AAC8QI70_9BACT|nr:Hypothetical protein AA314_09191 [Archangium gephyra]
MSPLDGSPTKLPGLGFQSRSQTTGTGTTMPGGRTAKHNVPS